MRWVVSCITLLVVGVALAAPFVDREETALAFVSEHHPELLPLLERLRASAPAEFAAAINDLERARERIEKFRDRPERYQAALAEWKFSSRIRLAIARLATSPSAEAESELRQLVSRRQDLRIATLRGERDRLATRLETVSAQIDAYESDRDAAIEKEFTALKPKQKSAAKGNRPTPKNKSERHQKPPAVPSGNAP